MANGYTPARLGLAVLGETILGKYDIANNIYTPKRSLYVDRVKSYTKKASPYSTKVRV